MPHQYHEYYEYNTCTSLLNINPIASLCLISSIIFK